jgi:LysM repeat protein
MKKLRLIVPLAMIVAVLLLMIAPAGALAAPDQGAPKASCLQWHYVRHGQTLAQIARMYGTSTAYLTAINGLSNPNRIYAGTSLCVRANKPGPGPHPAPGPKPKPCSDGFTYVVRHGDTLSSIGWRYGLSSAYLAQVNHLWNPNVIYAGQRLWIPGHGCW